MTLIRTLTMPLIIGGIVAGGAAPALASAAIPLPIAPTPLPVAQPLIAAQTRPPLAIVLHANRPYAAGAVNRYTILVRNEGRAEAKYVPVMLALPPSARFAGAKAGGIAQDGGVVWLADIKPLHQVTLHAQAIAGNPARGVEMVDVTACVLESTTTKQVCASDLIPVSRRSHHPARRR